jgi:tRNA (cytidine/uridine-2'-O-)-methyltransferase
MVEIVMVDPEIPQNTGSVVRLCAAVGARLHLVGNLAFSLDDAKLRRAGLDYWRSVVVGVYPDLESLAEALPDRRWFYLSKKGSVRYDKVDFREGDVLVFGSESTGLPQNVLDENESSSLFVPISSNVRSLNLSAAVHIVVYEANRQNGFKNWLDS